MPLLVPYNVKPEPVAPTQGGPFTVHYDDNLPLFAGVPNLSDIAQGSIADCFFLSSLIAIMHRPGGLQYIENMMVEDTKKRLVTVRMFENGKTIYLQTRKCRVRSAAGDAPVSVRNVCWPDVLEACASIFSMKTAHDAPVRTKPPTLENLNLGSSRHALAILMGGEIVSKAIPDTRPLDMNLNYGYGVLTVIFDAAQAPDRAFRDECVHKAFGAQAGAWNIWAAGHRNVWESYIRGQRNAATGIRVKSKLFDDFLKTQIPPAFHPGFHQLDKDLRFVEGAGLEAKFSEGQEAFFDHIGKAVADGYPVVLESREHVGRGGGGTAQAPLGEDMYKGMLGGHCYGVETTRTDVNSKMKFVLITNPWGRYVRSYDALTGKAIAVENKDGLGGGRFSITLHDLIKKFGCYAYAKRRPMS